MKPGRAAFAYAALFACAAAAVVVALPRYPAAGGDEVFLSMPALSFARDGVFRRAAMPGEFLYHVWDFFPPVPFVLLAAVYKLLGFGLAQTKMPALLATSVTAWLVFRIAMDATARRSNALFASFFTLANAVVFRSVFSGRPEPFFGVSLALALYFLFVRRENAFGAFASSAALGLAVLSYYPMAPWVGIVFVSGFVFLRERPTRSREAFFLGGGFVCFLFYLYVSGTFPALFRLQLFSQSPDYFARSLAEAARTLPLERERYFELIFRQLGFVDLAIVGFVLIRRSDGSGRQGAWLRFQMAALLVFLFLFKPKHSQYLCPLFVLAGVTLALAKSAPPKWLRAAFVCLALVRIFLVGGTAFYQREGRDYENVARELRNLIEPGSSVIAPQSAWFALAERSGTLHLYAQNRTRIARQVGEELLNDPAYLRRFRYFIWQPVYANGRFPALEREIAERCERVGGVHLPFKPLPWAGTAPYDMDVYRRRE